MRVSSIEALKKMAPPAPGKTVEKEAAAMLSGVIGMGSRLIWLLLKMQSWIWTLYPLELLACAHTQNTHACAIVNKSITGFTTSRQHQDGWKIHTDKQGQGIG